MRTVREKLPEFRELTQQLAIDLREKRFSAWKPLHKRISPLLEEEFVSRMDTVIPGWRALATLNGGQTAKHTLVVLALCLNLPEYTLIANEQIRHEIEWAALLHDIDKELIETYC